LDSSNEDITQRGTPAKIKKGKWKGHGEILMRGKSKTEEGGEEGKGVFAGKGVKLGIPKNGSTIKLFRGGGQNRRGSSNGVQTTKKKSRQRVGRRKKQHMVARKG